MYHVFQCSNCSNLVLLNQTPTLELLSVLASALIIVSDAMEEPMIPNHQEFSLGA